jgi:hypothetical protein
MLTTLEDAFSVAAWDLHKLRQTSLGDELYFHSKKADQEVAWLCQLAEEGSEDVRSQLQVAHRAVFELAQLLDEVDSDDRYTRDRLWLAREAVDDLLEALSLLMTRPLSA